MTIQQRITDNLDVMLSSLPPDITGRLTEIDRSDDLLEMILDVGRVPTARYLDGERTLLQREVTRDEFDLLIRLAFHAGRFAAVVVVVHVAAGTIRQNADAGRIHGLLELRIEVPGVGVVELLL